MSNIFLMNEADALERARMLSSIYATKGASAIDNKIRAKCDIMMFDRATGTAIIVVQGALVKNKTWMSEYFVETSYGEIIKATKEAEADERVTNIVYKISSPGGYMEGYEACANVVFKVQKPTRAVADGMCASAAYGLAAQCDRIEATEQSTMVGSVGVMQVFSRENQADAIAITNTTSPDKFPDVLEEEGRQIVQDTLNEVAALFIRSIARGRRVTTQAVNNDYGNGRVFTAEVARSSGMIDGILEEEIDSAEANMPERRIPYNDDDDDEAEAAVAAAEPQASSSPQACAEDTCVSAERINQKNKKEDGMDNTTTTAVEPTVVAPAAKQAVATPAPVSTTQSVEQIKEQLLAESAKYDKLVASYPHFASLVTEARTTGEDPFELSLELKAKEVERVAAETEAKLHAEAAAAPVVAGEEQQQKQTELSPVGRAIAKRYGGQINGEAVR